MSLADLGDGWPDLNPLWFVAAATCYVLVRLLFPLARRLARRSAIDWDDILLDRKVQNRISLLGPAVLIYTGVVRMDADGSAVDWSQRLAAASLVFVGALCVSSLLSAANHVYERRVVAQEQPIRAYVQLAQIVVYLVAVLLMGAALADRSPAWLLGGLGAATAVLMFVFRDTISSFIASVQLLQSDMIDRGDSIEVPSYDVAGDVTDVGLHKVTVRNFDGSMTIIPTHRLMTDPFRNWQQITDESRRRMKRSVRIDQSTIRFLEADEIAAFSRFEPLVHYMREKGDQIRRSGPVGAPDLIGDPRRLTNLGTLRAYIEAYLRSLDTVDTDSRTYLVRQLEGDAEGLPLEIYAFTTASNFAEFERIQADVLDHVLAMVPRFGLQIFQDPGAARSPRPATISAQDGSALDGSPSDTTP